MTFLKRIGFFVITNILVMVTVGIVWSLISVLLGFNGITGYIPTLMALSLVLGMTGSFISLLISKWSAKRLYDIQIIDSNVSDPYLIQLFQQVERLAKKAGLNSVPEVGIYESNEVNAFATGFSKNSSLVAVSTGLLSQMTQDEVDGVLGHELSHIANGDMVTMTLIQGIVNSFAFFFSRILANIISSQVDEKIRGVVHFICVILGDILFTLLGSFAVAYFSRKREFRADAGGARLSSRPNMISALRKLQTVFEPEADGSDQLRTFKISSKNETGGLLGLLMTHPPLEVRIKALESNLI